MFEGLLESLKVPWDVDDYSHSKTMSNISSLHKDGMLCTQDFANLVPSGCFRYKSKVKERR